MSNLRGRLARLEAAAARTSGPDACRTCGLRHVQPLTLALVRGLIWIAGSASRPFPRTDPLCLCGCCTADPGDGRFARLSHGLPPDGDVA
jgi:hypothetical protein